MCAVETKPEASSSARITCFLMLGLLALAGCAGTPETAHLAAQPQTAPVRTITSFDEPLRCMDNLFLAQGKKDIYITSAGVPDATGQIAAGTKEMLITAIAKMSARSNAFRFVDFDPTQIDVQMLSELIGLRPGFVAPNYYIRGAITQLDSNVLSSNVSAGISAPSLDLAASRGQIISVMSVDLNIGQLVTRQIMPGMSASNSIAVVRTGHSGEVGGIIGKVGLSLNVQFDHSEGFHQAVRNLIELSAIESLGKLTRVPYWQCLEIDQASPTYRTEARQWFDAMNQTDRIRFARSNLMRAGYLADSGGGDAVDAPLRDAIARYQSEHDLVPNGRVDFDLYYRLMSETTGAKVAKVVPSGAVVGSAPPAVNAATTATTSAAPAPAAPTPVVAPDLRLTTNRGDHPTYHVHETLAVQATATRDAFLYCYYQDADGTVARIFPNRFQPNALVHGAAPVQIPSASGHAFDIRFDKGHATEAVACVVSNDELGVKLPDKLKGADLAPLPVANLQGIISAFRQLGGGAMTEKWLSIEVM
jgi:curli biogenesis system outer membrane secretion channel CsgG